MPWSSTLSSNSCQPPLIWASGLDAVRRSFRRRDFANMMSRNGDSSTRMTSSAHPTPISTPSSPSRNAFGGGVECCCVSGTCAGCGGFRRVSGGGTTVWGWATWFGSFGGTAGMGRTGGLGSTVTQPYCSVSTSIQAETSLPRISLVPAPVVSGTKPITTRAGKPSSRAMRAAVTEYCSASPIMRVPVSSSLMRSSAWPDRLAGSEPTP